jgi:hypothetical protein
VIKVLKQVSKENKNERDEVKATWRKSLQGKMLRNLSLAPKGEERQNYFWIYNWHLFLEKTDFQKTIEC